MTSGFPIIVEYRPTWPREAEDLMAAVRSALGPPRLPIEHIGSTSIPGMAAKNVIDLQISVHDLAGAAREFEAPLAAIGFQASPYDHDHVPAGRNDDPAQWSKRLWLLRGRGIEANLHVRSVGSPNERLALLFRDWFRAHRSAVPAYGTFKTSLARIAPDLDSYADVKDPVVDLVVAIAEPWAEASGWRP
jgi:GrpB-like predicted nucleotidyltransferase (UPF0157 family)